MTGLEVAEKNTPLVIIIVCSFINLCRQWIDEIAAFGVTPLAWAFRDAGGKSKKSRSTVRSKSERLRLAIYSHSFSPKRL
ncbi:MAG: hypothetical protein P1V20_12405 [Verrucomicrobiales bacterium]|nr:hypothetical protein [Verrucomicrobiales bacterium]